MEATPRFPDSAHVAVYPFTRQGEGDEVVIGRADVGTFVALPKEAVAILDRLAAGDTVGQAAEYHEALHGERPDLDDLLVVLEERGLVQPRTAGSAAATWSSGPETAGPERSYHFTSIPRPLARALFGPVTLLASGAVIALAVVAAVLDPSILPPRDALFFEDSMTLKMLVLTLWSFFAIFLHEMGHLIAVRAAGVDSRLGLGHRLWVLVVETDMTGLWAVPRRARYLPVLAGPLIDAASLAVLLLVTFATHRGWIGVPPFGRDLMAGGALIYLLGLLWQCFFFVRTDFYYVFSIFFDCKNLLRDTEGFLRNLAARWMPRVGSVDQSGIPEKELRVIRAYSVVWLLGRVLALGIFFMVMLPLLFLYGRTVGGALVAGFSAAPYRYLDAVLLAAFGLIPLLIGIWMWSRSLFRRWREAT